jgi:hypothetical protein
MVAMVRCAYCGAPESEARGAFTRRWGDYYCSPQHLQWGRRRDDDSPLERLVRLPDRARTALELDAAERRCAADCIDSWISRLFKATTRAARDAVLEDVQLVGALTHEHFERNGPDRLAELFDEARALIEAVLEYYRGADRIRRDPSMLVEPPGGRALLRLELQLRPTLPRTDAVFWLRHRAMQNTTGSPTHEMFLPGVLGLIDELEARMEADAAAEEDPSWAPAAPKTRSSSL